MNGWKEYKLTELCEILDSRRKPLSSGERSKIKGIYPYYGASGIIDYINDYIFEEDSILISEDGENLNSRKTPIAFRAKGKYWVNNHAHILKPKYDFYYPIIINYLANMDLSPLITGAVQPKLSQDNLTKISFELPTNESEQRAIAGMLSSLDDKIDLLHRQNKTLEGMAEALWRKIFVEEADSKWKIDELGNLFDVGIGRTPPRKEHQWFTTTANDVKWVSIRDMGVSGIYIDSVSEYLTREAISKFNIPLIPPNTVLLSFKMTIGRLALTTEEMISNEAIAHFKIKDKSYMTSEYLYFFLKAFKFESLGSTSSIVEAINSQMIKEMEVPVPPQELIRAFKNNADQYFAKIKTNQRQIFTLSHLRDTLLPKLMSGEIRVKV
jgi:type I restriction enzyme S subunit